MGVSSGVEKMAVGVGLVSLAFWSLLLTVKALEAAISDISTSRALFMTIFSLGHAQEAVGHNRKKEKKETDRGDEASYRADFSK